MTFSLTNRWADRSLCKGASARPGIEDECIGGIGYSSPKGHTVGLGRESLRLRLMDTILAAQTPAAASSVPASSAITARPRGAPPGLKT